MTNKIDGPIAKAQLLIRKPVDKCSEALVDPAITSRFWFSKGSGRLETSNGMDLNPSLVEWTFEDKGDNTIFVVVKNWEFKEVAEAIDSTEGFTFLIAALKVFLEHAIEPISSLTTPPMRSLKDGLHAERPVPIGVEIF